MRSPRYAPARRPCPRAGVRGRGAGARGVSVALAPGGASPGGRTRRGRRYRVRPRDPAPTRPRRPDPVRRPRARPVRPRRSLPAPPGAVFRRGGRLARPHGPRRHPAGAGRAARPGTAIRASRGAAGTAAPDEPAARRPMGTVTRPRPARGRPPRSAGRPAPRPWPEPPPPPRPGADGPDRHRPRRRPRPAVITGRHDQATPHARASRRRRGARVRLRLPSCEISPHPPGSDEPAPSTTGRHGAPGVSWHTGGSASATHGGDGSGTAAELSAIGALSYDTYARAPAPAPHGDGTPRGPAGTRA
ncbi:hypothetical protein SFUMM280S_11461 [Streptomyces fumanus]